ncbi:MAG TPA: CPBP family intramembrane glutamic endopeptidase [Phycisphaerae bacterium]|nr:CPBP family intramembrane glutamic endopeptidase [Phycisphaerae bacterium]
MTHSHFILDALDYLLVGAGGMVLVLAAWRWRRAGGRDPLRGSPVRANRLNLIAVWCCLMAYAAGGMAGVWLGRAWTPGGIGGKVKESWESVLASSMTQVVVVASCVVVAMLFFRARLAGFGLGRRFGATAGWTGWWIAGGLLASFCCTGVVVLAAQWVIRLLWPDFRPPEHGVFTTLNSSQATLAMRILAIGGAAVLAPMGEECLFRGILQTGIKKLMPPRRGSVYHRWAAIWLTATAFGLLHVATPQFVPALIVLGVILGYLYERTGSLWVPIVVHMLFNAKSLLWYHVQAHVAGMH